MAKRARHKQDAGAGGVSRVRIIGGSLRGRWLEVAERDGLRPTGNRQREMLFNWLAMDLPGAHCLDAFAGSGALGIEALSRDAASVTCLEKDAALTSAIKRQAQDFGVAQRLRVESCDALRWLDDSDDVFDIAFVDPPFAAGLWEAMLERLAAGRIRAGGLVYLEYPAPEPPFAIGPPWQVERSKRCAGVVCSLLRLSP